MLKACLALALLLTASVASANQNLVDKSCKIRDYIDIDFYLGKSYLNLPKSVRAVSPGGNFKYEKFWEVLEDGLADLKLHNSNVRAASFHVYKNVIYGVSIHFDEAALSNGSISVDDMLASCGRIYEAGCSLSANGRTSMRPIELGGVFVSDLQIVRKAGQLGHDKNYPCY